MWDDNLCVKVLLLPAAQRKADRARLLTAFVNLLGAPFAAAKRHPAHLALMNDGITRFHDDFVHMTTANVDSPQHRKTPASPLVPLEMNHKIVLRAPLVFFHHVSHKQCGSVNILKSTAQEFKLFCNTKHNPTQEIFPWGMILSKIEGLSNWNKMLKPSARVFKPFRESNNWVKHKESFLIALEAQNLTHLVDKSHVVINPDLGKAQLKHLCKVMKDNFIHHQAKSIVKFHAKAKDWRAVWEQVCKTHDNSISTSMNGDAILGWLATVQLHACN